MKVVEIQYETNSTGVQSLYTSVGSRYAYNVNWQTESETSLNTYMLRQRYLNPNGLKSIQISPLCSFLSHRMCGTNTCAITL